MAPPVIDVSDDPAALTAGLLAEEDRRQAERSTGPRVELAGVEVPALREQSLRDALRVGGRRTIGVLFLLNVVDEFDRVALFVLGPDIQESFGISDAVLAFLNGVGGVLIFAGAIPFGLLADRRSRVPIVGVATLAWSLFALLGGFARSALHLGATRIVNGLGKGVTPVHSSILADAYPAAARGRIFAIHAAANPVGNAVGPFLAGAIAAIAGGTSGWRWSLGILAVPAAVLAVIAFRLPEPERGQFDRDDGELPDVGVSSVSLAAGFERLRQIRSFSSLMAGLGALGFAIAGAPTVFNLFLEERHGLGAFQRGVVGSVIALGSAAGALVGGPLVDRLHRRSPPTVLVVAGASLGVFGVLYPAALYLSALPLLVAVHVIAFAFVAAPLVSINTVVAAVVPPRLRGLGFAFVGLYLFLVGGLMGGTLVGWFSDALGQRTALALVVPISCGLGGLLIARAARTVRHDIALVADEWNEERSARERRDRSPNGATVLLEVRDVDFSYGPVQVLFDVDLDVHEGEVLALLGTNGAGKSTLLRVISGLAVPSRGAVRLEGETVTFSDPASRVRRGIVQVPGGKAIFPSLSVAENLQAGAYTYIWERDRVRANIGEVLELFPRLAERFDQPAGTLSGGEQQMLAIAKALLLEPRVLLIDELSLGLAPVVVQELLQIVERLSAEGMTIVVVEQSVNVALSMASRAVFMEKGQVRFQGAAAELLERDDLLRAVFLGGDGG